MDSKKHRMKTEHHLGLSLENTESGSLKYLGAPRGNLSGATIHLVEITQLLFAPCFFKAFAIFWFHFRWVSNGVPSSGCFRKPVHCTGAQPSRLFSSDSPRRAVDSTDIPSLTGAACCDPKEMKLIHLPSSTQRILQAYIEVIEGSNKKELLVRKKMKT